MRKKNQFVLYYAKWIHLNVTHWTFKIELNLCSSYTQHTPLSVQLLEVTFLLECVLTELK